MIEKFTACSMTIPHNPLPPIKKLNDSSTKNVRLSAKAASIICPGIGQLLEGRYPIGLLQLTVFLVSFMLSTWIVGHWVWNLVHDIVDFSGPIKLRYNAPRSSIPWLPMGTCLGISILVYIWSIVDAGKGGK